MTLQELREIAEKATPGPWFAVNASDCWRVNSAEHCICKVTTSYKDPPTDNPDVTHIARFDPATVLLMLDVGGHGR